MYKIIIGEEIYFDYEIKWVRELIIPTADKSIVIGATEDDAQGILFNDEYYHIKDKPEFVNLDFESVEVIAGIEPAPVEWAVPESQPNLEDRINDLQTAFDIIAEGVLGGD